LPARNFLGIEGQAGYGHWSRTASGQFVIDYKTESPNGQVRQVHALTTVSGSGNELTGTATVKLILGRHQVRTVEREKWLAFLDKVPDVIARLSVLIVVGWATRRAKRIQETTVRLVDRGAALNSLDVLEWHLRVSQSKT